MPNGWAGLGWLAGRSVVIFIFIKEIHTHLKPKLTHGHDGFRGAALLILAVELRELRAHPLHTLPGAAAAPPTLAGCVRTTTKSW